MGGGGGGGGGEGWGILRNEEILLMGWDDFEMGLCMIYELKCVHYKH